MSVRDEYPGEGELRIPAGDVLVLRVAAQDPTGIARILIQCFQFSMGNSNRAKFAVGSADIDPEERFSHNSFEVGIRIPDNAAIGKWGVQMIEFTNGRGYKSSFYRGQDKFDDIVFQVVSRPREDDHPLCLEGVTIAGLRRGA